MSRELLPFNNDPVEKSMNVLPLQGQVGNRMIEHLGKIVLRRAQGENLKARAQFDYMQSAGELAKKLMGETMFQAMDQLRELPYFIDNPSEYWQGVREGDALSHVDSDNVVPMLQRAVDASPDVPFVDAFNELQPSLRQYGRQRIQEVNDRVRYLRRHRDFQRPNMSHAEYYKFLQDPANMIDDYLGFTGLQPLYIDPAVARRAAAQSEIETSKYRAKRAAKAWYFRNYLPKLRSNIHENARRMGIPLQDAWYEFVGKRSARVFDNQEIWDYIRGRGSISDVLRSLRLPTYRKDYN